MAAPSAEARVLSDPGSSELSIMARLGPRGGWVLQHVSLFRLLQSSMSMALTKSLASAEHSHTCL